MDTEAYTNDLHEALMKKKTLISGTVGNLSLKLKVNVVRLTVALIVMLLLISSPIILKTRFPLMTLSKPNRLKVITLLYVSVTMVCLLLKPNILTLNLSVRL